MNKKNNPNCLYLTRFYKAPLKLVWQVWTDPDHAAKWWGPRGFTITTHSKEFKEGGVWHYTMHGPDGVDYPNKAKYLQIEEYKRMIYDHGGYDDRPPLFRVTVDFSESKDGTRLDMEMEFKSPEVAQEMELFIKKAGGTGTWDRLAEYLEEKQENKKVFVINRSFKAPINVVYDMWVKPEHFAKWIAPTGFETQFLEADIRNGGKTFYCMTNGEITMYGQAHYLKIEPPHKLVYTQQFCDKEGHISRHPHAPIWPETMLTSVEFNAESENQTRVTVTWECYGNYTTEELDFFVNARSGMTQGWTGSFDKLETLLG